MKNIVKIIASIILFLCLLTSCTKEDNTKKIKDPMDDLDQFKLKISLEGKIEDYEYFWDYIYNGWPFLEICERRGIDLKKIKAEGYKKLEDLKFKVDYMDFYDDLTYEITGKKAIGHLWPMDYIEYFIFKNEHHFPVIDSNGVENIKVKKFYSSIPNDPFYDGCFKPRFTMHSGEHILPQTKIIEDGKIAYIKIATFYMSERKKKQYYSIIENFLKKTKDYKHMIIDISRNNGGEFNYWLNLVRYTLDEDKKIDLKYYSLYNENKYTKLMLSKFLSHYRTKDVSINDIKNIDRANTKKNNKAFLYTLNFTPVQKGHRVKVRKDRKNWVLIDENTFSSADCFSFFCKSTSWATLIGSPTGGGGLNIDLSGGIALPNSGLLIKSDMIYSLNTDGTCNAEYGTIPDIYTAEGKTALETCLDAIEEWDENNRE